jgi:uncharacterized membrane protein YphA (DoxX/SURF4 family)
MKTISLLARILLGLVFFVFGLNGFLAFIPMGPMPTGAAAQFFASMSQSHYMTVIFTLEVLCGALLLAGQFVPLALTVLAPLIVNIFLFHAETFSVDESWLSRQRLSSTPSVSENAPGLLNRHPAEEKVMIEAALRECGGQVAGPSGAAARLGVPGSTLESKIKALKINKSRFKRTDPSKDS